MTPCKPRLTQTNLTSQNKAEPYGRQGNDTKKQQTGQNDGTKTPSPIDPAIRKTHQLRQNGDAEENDEWKEKRLGRTRGLFSTGKALISMAIVGHPVFFLANARV